MSNPTVKLHSVCDVCSHINNCYVYTTHGDVTICYACLVEGQQAIEVEVEEAIRQTQHMKG